MVHYTIPARLGPACGAHGVSTRDPSRVTCPRCLATTNYRTAADFERFILARRHQPAHDSTTTA